MYTTRPWITGAAFAAIAAIINVVCSLAVLFNPDAVIQLANSWAHGIDFTIIRRAADQRLSFANWGAGIGSSALLAFLVGMVYRGISNYLAHSWDQCRRIADDDKTEG